MASFDFIVGDSIAAGTAIAAGIKRSGSFGVKSSDDKGISKVGASPKEVLDFLKEIGDSKLKDKIVILSSGISNGPDSIDKVKEQLKYLQGLNCKVYLIGVSNDPTNASGKNKFPKLVGMNEKLTEAAKEYNFVFLGGFKPSSDNIHPSSYQTYYKDVVVTKLTEPWPTTPTQTVQLSGDVTANSLTPSGLSPSGMTPSGLTPSPPVPPPPPIKGTFVFNIEKPGILSSTALGELTITEVQLGAEDFFYFGDDPGIANEIVDDEYSEGAFAGSEEDIAFDIEEGRRLSQGQELLADLNTDDPAVANQTEGDNGNPNDAPSESISTEATGKIKKMLEVAKATLGYTEKYNANLTSNKRPGKDTKFGVYWGLNGHHYCGMFVCWCAEHAGMKVTNRDKKPYEGSMPNSIACPTGVNIFKSKDCWVSNGNNKSERQNSKIKPEPGDIVFFSWDYNQKADHVGMVVKDNGDGTVKCYEGNTSPGKSGANQKGSGCWERDRSKATILGYGKTALWDPQNLQAFTGPAGKAAKSA